MAPKMMKASMTSAHAAGIYADMTVDGPEIGTLIVIIDRARNLPNRKTMGKQDPYCAARLGKEAKKTETDKRGGQTPKWDQELRFTVHESPDYYQLKVSVFNDDKKTDLIGETWVQLEKVIVPGGGQNDAWHGLNCKGRFAGEIRIEITYYDTRPKPEKAVQPGASTSQLQNRSQSDALYLPRPQQAVKRRPLPTDPRAQEPLTPPHRPAMQDIPKSNSMPQMLTTVHTPSQDSPRHFAPSNYYTSEHTMYYNESPRYEDSGVLPPARLMPNAHSEDEVYLTHNHDSDRKPFEQPEPEIYQPQARRHQHFPDLDLPEIPPLRTERQGQSYRNAQPGHDTRGDREYQSTPPSIPQYKLMPEPRPSAHRSPVGSQFAPVEEHGPPPPPPVHRSSFAGPSSSSNSPRYGRSTMANSPLGATYLASVDDDAPYRPPESFSLLSSQSEPPALPSSGYSAHPTSRYHDASRAKGQPLQSQYDSPQQVAMYQPSSMERAQDDLYDRMFSMPTQQRPLAIAPKDTYDHLYRYDDVYQGQPLRSERPPHAREQSSLNERKSQQFQDPGYSSHPDEQARHLPPVQSPSRDCRVPYDECKRAHRQSAPIIRPRAVSPNLRTTTTRKSVSPHPPASAEPRFSGVAFSPDSFNVLNPNMGSASNNPRTDLQVRIADSDVHLDNTYATPERLVPSPQPTFRDDGPIIDHMGKVVDPSDHLPISTWAPEPEPKKTRKPEVRIRLKSGPGPQGAQPMPSVAPRAPRESINLPALASTVQQPHLIDSPSPSTTAGQRNRLQTKFRLTARDTPSMGAVNMSPGCTTSPGQPLMENPNYSYDCAEASPGDGGGGGTYVRASPQGPPIPAKVPIGMGREDRAPPGVRDPLAEELGRIEIGSGNGRATGRRGRFATTLM